MDPRKLEAEIREILKLYGSRQTEMALKRSRFVLGLAPNLAITNYCVGHGLAEMRDPAGAISYLLKATELAPGNADYLVKLGLTYLDLGDIRLAQNILDKARKINPKLVSGQWALGVFYASIDRFDEASKLFKDVIEGSSSGGVSSGALLDWCRALIGSGQTQEARGILQNLIRQPAIRSKALARLAELEPFALDSDEYLQIERDLASENLPGSQKASLLTAKARCVGAAKDHDQEFKLLAESKKVRGSHFDAKEFEGLVDGIIAMFRSGAFDRARKLLGDSSFSPIFVVGLPRSGTTLTERILARHSNVGGAGELSVIRNFLARCCGNNPPERLIEAMEEMGSSQVTKLARNVESTMRFLCPGKERIIDKMPGNFLHVGWICAMFPRARIVHCYRNPADNLLSGFKASLNSSHSYFDSPEWFSSCYRQYVRLMRFWYELFPDRVHPLRYEDLVTEPERAIRALLAHCDLSWEEECLHPEDNSSRILTASVLQARSPINARSVGGWKRYAAQLQPVPDELADLMPVPETPSRPF